MNDVLELRMEIRPDVAGHHVKLLRRGSSHALEARHQADNVVFDQAKLTPLRRDARAYGAELARQLFASTALRDGFVSALAAAEQESARLAVSLVLEDPLSPLATIRWETLTDPRKDAPDLLFKGGSQTFSRLFYSGSAPAFPLRVRDELRVVLAVASPSDAESNGLAPFDGAAERERAAELFAKAGIAAEVCLSDAGACTADAVASRLRRGCDVLYLVCHGTLDRSATPPRPLLLLQRPDGTADIIDAREQLVDLVAKLPSPPALVVLSSCESGGNGGDDDVLFALGPLLAVEANVPAVVAMRGSVSMSTAAQFAAAFFDELLLSGRVSQAVDRARDAVAKAGDWWMPALFTRAADPLAFDPIDDMTELGREVTKNCNRNVNEAIRRCDFATNKFYVPRDLESRFDDFLRSDKAAMVIIGQSGMGKTTLVARLVTQYAAAGNHLCFFIGSEQLPGDVRVVEDAIVEQLTNSGMKPPEFWKAIDRYCSARGRKLVIFIDAVNEYNRTSGVKSPTAVDFLKRLDRIADRAHTQYRSIRYVITMRPETWGKGVEKNRVRVNNSDGAYFLSERGKVPEAAHVLTTFSEREAEEAYRKYCSSENYDIGTPRDQLSGLTRHLLRDPLLLALTCDVYKGGEIPAELEIGDVFSQYRERLAREVPDADAVIENVVTEMFAPDGVVFAHDAIDRTALRQRNRTLYDDLNPDNAESVGAALVERNVLRRGAEIRFTYDRFLEFVVSERLIAHVRTAASRSDATELAVATVQANLPTAQKLNTAFGSLRRMLVRLQSEEVDYARVVERIASDERGLSLVVSVLGRIARTQVGTEPDGLSVLSGVLDDVRRSIDAAIEKKLPRPGFPILDAVYRMLLDSEYRVWLAERPEARRQEHIRTLYDFFRWGMCHADSAIAGAAKQYLYFLWQDDEAYVDAAAITDVVVGEVTPIGVRALTNARWRTILFNVTSLFLMALPEVHAAESAAKLLDCGRRLVRTLDLQKPSVRIALGILATNLGRWGLQQILKDAPYAINLSSLERVISTGALRDEFRAALALLDDARPLAPEVEAEFQRLAAVDNSHVMLAVTMALGKRFETAGSDDDSAAVLRLIDRILSSGSTAAEYTASLALYEINYFGSRPTLASMQSFERATTEILRTRKGRFLCEGVEKSYNVIGTFGRARVRNQALYGGDADDRLRTRPLQFAIDALEKAKADRDLGYYSYICQDIGLLGVLIEPQDVFAVVNYILADIGCVEADTKDRLPMTFDAGQKRGIEDAVLQSLANIRVLYTEETDKFLLDGLERPDLYAGVVRRTPRFELAVFVSWTFEQLLFRMLTRNYDAVGRELLTAILDALSPKATPEQFIVAIIRRMLVRVARLAAE